MEFLRNTGGQAALSFLSHGTLLAKLLVLKMMPYRKREKGYPYSFFNFCPFLLINKLKVVALVEYVCIKNWKRNSGSISTILVKQYLYIYELQNTLCNFSDSTYELNAPMFLFKTGTAQDKMHSKIHVNNLELYYLRMILNSK